MGNEEAHRHELEEAQRQLRAVEVEIERLSEQVPGLEEKLRLAEQKNIDEQTKKGVDPLDVQPSKEVLQARRALEENGRVIEKFTNRKTEILVRIENLQVTLLEDELIRQTKLFAKLKEREMLLEEELKTVQEEIAKVEKKKEEIALRVAEKTATQE